VFVCDGEDGLGLGCIDLYRVSGLEKTRFEHCISVLESGESDFTLWYSFVGKVNEIY
jgi:hypothetical protein